MDPLRERAARLLVTHRAMLLGYIAAIVRDRDLTEDVFQNVALVVVDKAEAFATDNDFPPWARRVARLEALTALRRLRKAPTLVDPSLIDVLERDWEATDGPSPEEAALRACLEGLSPYARRLIELRYADGLSGVAVAEHLNRSRNTVYVALSRAYRCLAACVRRRLAQEGPRRE